MTTAVSILLSRCAAGIGRSSSIPGSDRPRPWKTGWSWGSSSSASAPPMLRSMVAKNNLLPKLDLQTTVGFQGLAPIAMATRPDNSSSDAAYQLLAGPVARNPDRATAKRRAIHRRAAASAVAGDRAVWFLIEQISQDVKTALRDVARARERASAPGARHASRRRTRCCAIEQQEEHGEALTPTFVQLKLDSPGAACRSTTGRGDAAFGTTILDRAAWSDPRGRCSATIMS